ncbi:uncharacterized protein LOC109709477 [Ananas comosus]|uniref:Uncharacterized protein LOC109709477 n=1 Tax=Ananas comosus TaxID=4615 RepID=A0A6P5EUZ8_ANACO|nr:uncharacterized protein LOC109709477 [Ananas comosus]
MLRFGLFIPSGHENAIPPRASSDPSAGFDFTSRKWIEQKLLDYSQEAERFGVMASHLIVEINFQRLLRNICEKFSLPPPRYGITVGSSDQFCAFVDVEVPRCSRFMEVITYWDSPSSDSSLSENKAARTAIETLRNELQFDIRDANYTGKNYFKNLYDSASQKYEDFRNEYEMLKKEHVVLKRFHKSLLDERDRILGDWNEIRASIGKCHNLLAQSDIDLMDTDQYIFAAEKLPTAEDHLPANEACAAESASGTEKDPEPPSNYYRN